MNARPLTLVTLGAFAAGTVLLAAPADAYGSTSIEITCGREPGTINVRNARTEAQWPGWATDVLWSPDGSTTPAAFPVPAPHTSIVVRINGQRATLRWGLGDVAASPESCAGGSTTTTEAPTTTASVPPTTATTTRATTTTEAPTTSTTVADTATTVALPPPRDGGSTATTGAPATSRPQFTTSTTGARPAPPQLPITGRNDGGLIAAALAAIVAGGCFVGLSSRRGGRR